MSRPGERAAAGKEHPSGGDPALDLVPQQLQSPGGHQRPHLCLVGIRIAHAEGAKPFDELRLEAFVEVVVYQESLGR
jgi:hypothetical protein